VLKAPERPRDEREWPQENTQAVDENRRGTMRILITALSAAREMRRCSSGTAPRTSYWTVKLMVLLAAAPVELKLAWAVTEYIPVEDFGLSL